MKSISVLILVILWQLPGAIAQNIYQSLEGHILISGEYKGKTVLAQSHELNLFLDYTTKEFKGKLDLATLDTGIDSLNAKLAAIKPAQVLFSGVVPDDDFITWEHSELEFDIPITVQCIGETLYPSLDIKLNHYKDSGTYACLLFGALDLNISALDNKIEGLDSILNVEFTQVLLKRN